ncbi:MAG: ABC transporter substrate-binding protein, partial [Treponema sp.]|nr:ABC transporter substrate-binding protein [Treponema sp.]
MKQNKTKLLAATAILAVFTAIFLSCTSGKTETLDLRYGFTTEPTTLDPLNRNNTADGRIILFNVFEGLVKPNTDGTLLPCIAESWTIEQGGLVYNFTVREGVRFHDGSLLTLADVKFSLDTAAAAGFNSLSVIEEVRIAGENRISVILTTPDVEFLPYLTVGIVKAGNRDREKDIIGTGPFYIESYTPQRNLVLRKFDNYWQQNIPQLEKVTIVFFANIDALMVALRGGSIDGARLTGSMAAQLDHRHFDIIDSYSAAVQLLALNNASAPFDDIRVRRALNYGIDVQNIIDTAFFGKGIPSGSPLIPGLSVYYEASLSYPYNPDMARALLAEAGYSEDNRLSFEITAPSNYSIHVDTAQVISGQLEKIGITATIRMVDWSTWLSDVYFARQYQATVISLDSPSVSPRGFLSRYRSGIGGNFLNFSSTDFDRIYGDI